MKKKTLLLDFVTDIDRQKCLAWRMLLEGSIINVVANATKQASVDDCGRFAIAFACLFVTIRLPSLLNTSRTRCVHIFYSALERRLWNPFLFFDIEPLQEICANPIHSTITILFNKVLVK